MSEETSAPLSAAIELPGGRLSTDGLRLEFERRSGRNPTGIWAAPGRVNLMGDHTDYNDGYVLPVAIDRSIRVAGAARPDSRIRVWSLQMEAECESDLDDLQPGAVQGWAAYALGAAWSLRKTGMDPVGSDLVVDSNLPPGAGLASSAALVTAVSMALSELGGERLQGAQLAEVAHRAEVEFVGVPCGQMDQMVSVLALTDHALFVDFRAASYKHVRFAPKEAGLALLVVDTGIAHRLLDGEYAARRRACVEAAKALGIASLRDLPVGDLPLLNGLPRAQSRLVRHVVTENARVLSVVEALGVGDYAAVGGIFLESHESLRNDYEVSTPELDAAVRVAVEAGAIGARMTGAGFGGSAIALSGRDGAESLAHGQSRAFRELGFATPRIFPVETSAGACRIV